MKLGEKMSEEGRLKMIATKSKLRNAGVRPNRFRRAIIDNGDGTATVPLTKGFDAVIDSDDIPLVSGWNWYAAVRKHTVYSARHNSDGSHSYLHHVIFGKKFTDHRDNNGLNNRRSNLRECPSGSFNNANMRPRTLRPKGVDRSGKSKWRARTKVNGKFVLIGTFNTEGEASRAYNDFMVNRYGDFAYLNT